MSDVKNHLSASIIIMISEDEAACVQGTYRIKNGSQRPVSKGLLYSNSGNDPPRSSSTLGIVRQRGLTTWRIDKTAGSFASAVINVRHLRASNSERCAAGLLRGEMRNSLQDISKTNPFCLISQHGTESSLTHHITSFDRSKNHGRESHIVGANVGQDSFLAVLTCAELLHDPPG